jgi:osmoprotectant transport system substrate-binding protein
MAITTSSRTLRLLVGVVAVLGLAVAACGSDDDTAGDDTTAIEGPTITIGAQDFGESAILAEIYGQALTASGYTVAQQSLGGFRDISMGALSTGEINFAPEYVASLLEFLNDQAGEATGDVTETMVKLETELTPLGLVALEPAPGVDTNAFVVTAETSERLGVTSLSDLATVDEPLRLGGPADCETNPFCIPGLAGTYNVDLSENFVGLDAGVVATAMVNGEIDVAVLFSTDGRIADAGWVLLDDDQSMLAADNIVPVVTAELIEAYGGAMAAIVNGVSERITTEVLTELNRQFDVDKESAADIARAWLTSEGLL